MIVLQVISFIMIIHLDIFILLDLLVFIIKQLHIFIFSKIDDIDKCEEFDGISYKGNKTTCCAKQCGACGESGCSKRPGGSTKCCSGAIPQNQRCGINGQRAPCHIEIENKNGESHETS